MKRSLAQTLWDLLAPARPKLPQPSREHASAARKRRSHPVDVPAPKSKRTPMQARYDALVTEMKQTYGIRVRKWRNSSSGCAWEVKYASGSVARLIEAPYPKGPMSCAIFLHEIGHHAIGFNRYRPRCLEEYHAWRWSLETMHAHGFNVTDAVKKRMSDSLRYAVAKARRRGLRQLPEQLQIYDR
jgi:hypothetical protein